MEKREPKQKIAAEELDCVRELLYDNMWTIADYQFVVDGRLYKVNRGHATDWPFITVHDIENGLVEYFGEEIAVSKLPDHVLTTIFETITPPVYDI